MRTYKAFIFIKTTALTLFAMTAGAGCCYRIMAEPQPYIMPVESISYEIETLSHEMKRFRQVLNRLSVSRIRCAQKHSRLRNAGRKLHRSNLW